MITHCGSHRPGLQVSHSPSAWGPSSRVQEHPIAEEAGSVVQLCVERKGEQFGKQLLSQKPWGC